MDTELVPELENLYKNAAWDDLLAKASNTHSPEIVYYKVFYN